MLPTSPSDLVRIISLKCSQDKTKTGYKVVLPHYYARKATSDRLLAGRNVLELQNIVKRIDRRLTIMSICVDTFGNDKYSHISGILEEFDSIESQSIVDSMSLNDIVDRIETFIHHSELQSAFSF